MKSIKETLKSLFDGNGLVEYKDLQFDTDKTFLDAFGASSYEDLLKKLETDTLESEWQSMYENKNPKFDELMLVRRKIAFLLSVKKGIFDHYMAGDTESPDEFTEVDAFRKTMKPYANREAQQEYLEKSVGD